VLQQLGLKSHLHTFRHSFISHAAMCELPERILRQWIGHVDPKILERYFHLADAESHAAMRRLADNDADPGDDQKRTS
jgi:integrase